MLLQQVMELQYWVIQFHHRIGSVSVFTMIYFCFFKFIMQNEFKIMRMYNTNTIAPQPSDATTTITIKTIKPIATIVVVKKPLSHGGH